MVVARHRCFANPLMLAVVLTLAAAVPYAGHADTLPPVMTVQQLDLDRFMGRWYEIARLPNGHQANCASNDARTFERLSDAALRVTASCRHGDGSEEQHEVVARVRDFASRAKLELRYAPRAFAWLPFVWDDYWVIDIDPAYQHALVGDPARQSLWILSRQPVMEATAYHALVEIADKQGFTTQKLLHTPQSALAQGNTVNP